MTRKEAISLAPGDYIIHNARYGVIIANNLEEISIRWGDRTLSTGPHSKMWMVEKADKNNLQIEA